MHHRDQCQCVLTQCSQFLLLRQISLSMMVMMLLKPTLTQTSPTAFFYFLVACMQAMHSILSFCDAICDPITQNESHWYLVTIQRVTIFDQQVKNIDFPFSSKSGASGIFLFENITFNGQMWCFMTVSGILNCNCCNTVVYETNFLSPIFQNGTLYSSQIDLSITFEPVGRFA